MNNMKAEEHRRLANKAMNLLFDTKARLAQALDDLESELEEIDRMELDDTPCTDSAASHDNPVAVVVESTAATVDAVDALQSSSDGQKLGAAVEALRVLARKLEASEYKFKLLDQEHKRASDASFEQVKVLRHRLADLSGADICFGGTFLECSHALKTNLEIWRDEFIKNHNHALDNAKDEIAQLRHSNGSMSTEVHRLRAELADGDAARVIERLTTAHAAVMEKLHTAEQQMGSDICELVDLVSKVKDPLRLAGYVGLSQQADGLVAKYGKDASK